MNFSGLGILRAPRILQKRGCARAKRSHLPFITPNMASTQNIFQLSTSNPICDDQTTKSRTKSVNMSTTTTITEQASVSTHLPILTIPPALLGLYGERYGPQSAVASCNPSDTSTPNSLDFSLQTRFILIHLASQRCTLDCRDHPGGPLTRRGDVPTLDQPCASTCRPGPHNHPAPTHQKYLTIAHVLSKKTFQTVSKCSTTCSCKFSAICS